MKIIFWVTVFMVVVLGSIFFTGKEEADLIAKHDDIVANLGSAEENLAYEKQRLADLTLEFQNMFPLGVSAQDQIKNSSQIVAGTDFLFIDAYGENPAIKINNPALEDALNLKRQIINSILSVWQAKTGASFLPQINLSESQQIKNEIEIIKEYIQNLSEIIQNLTPGNSGLSQFQIDTYADNIPSVAEIEEVLANLEESINNNPTVPLPPPSSLADQEEVVEEAQAEVDALEEELEEIEEALQPPTSGIPEETVPPVDEEDDSPEDEFVAPDPGGSPEGIIIQPGPVRLIQGTDPY